MATPQTPLRAPEALQEPGDHRRLPAEERRSGKASTTTGLVGKRMVAACLQPTGQVGHAQCMVRSRGAGEHGGSPRCVEPRRKPPWYVTRMPGGVRGGRREASPYSIIPAFGAIPGSSPRMTWSKGLYSY